jgi:hypothetical protein
MIYIASLVLLAAAVALSIFRPLARGAHYNDVQRESLIRNEREWVLQLDLVNNGDAAETYQIRADKDGQIYDDQVSLNAQQEYSYIQHFPRQAGQDHNLDVTVYSPGLDRPVERLHYNLE